MDPICNDTCIGTACQCKAPPYVLKCPHSPGVFPCSGAIFPNLLLMVFYGGILAIAAKFISDGAEMLLVVWNPGIIGGFVLPVLGAVPDAAIVICSAAVGTYKVALAQVSVGMGTLAGSTIMLLTIPFCLSMFVARVDIDPETKRGIDQQTTNDWKHPWTFCCQGISFGYDVPVNAIISIVTSLSYFVVQGIAFYYVIDKHNHTNVKVEKWFAMAGFIICFGFFIGFSVYQVLNDSFAKKLAEKAKKKHDQYVRESTAKQFAARMVEMRNLRSKLDSDEEAKRMNATKHARFWKKIALAVIRAREADEIRARQIEASQAGREEDGEGEEVRVQLVGEKSETTPLFEEEQEEEEEAEEYESWPHWRIYVSAFFWMILGTGLVTFFSDPMVDVISKFSELVGLDQFFVSFVVTPICSNASELVASLSFASHRKASNNTITFSQLYGASIMNNTLCLGVFFVIVFARGIPWTFSAETLTIFLATVAMGVLGICTWCCQKTLRMFMAIPIFLIYPISLAFVALLQSKYINLQ